MFGTLHGVFLSFLALALAWNLFAARRAGGWRTPEALFLLPLQLAATAVLLHDRLAPPGVPWLTRGPVPFLFPLLFVLALAQNALVLRRRGARLADLPLVLFNAAVGLVLLVASVAATGLHSLPAASALLHDHLLLQALLGSHLSPLWSVSWHVPFLLRREPPQSLAGVLAGTLPAAVAAFGAVLLVALHGSSQQVLASFADEPRVAALRDGLSAGAWVRQASGDPPAEGDLEAWVLPADHPGTGLPPAERPLVLALLAPAGWRFTAPAPEACLTAFVEAAERLAAALQPALLLPFPEPDGEAPLFLAEALPLQRWVDAFAEARQRVRAVSPSTRIGVRLAGSGPASERLLREIASVVDVAGPRLQPGGSQRGGAAWADEVLATWQRWRDDLAAPPELWILAAGASPLGYGEHAQAAFVEGCLARADRDPEIAGVLLVGGRDVGHTLGLRRANGDRRLAAAVVERLLRSSPGAAGR